MTDVQEDYILKVVVIGESGVGKTNLIGRYTKNVFVNDTKSTIGFEIRNKVINTPDGDVIKVQFWDTAGQERFRALTRGYYRGADGAVIVFSLTDHNSFEKIDSWIEELESRAEKDIFIMLLGNKSDLVNERTVGEQEVLDYATKRGLLYMETSALSNTNVSEAFEKAVLEIYNRNKVENDNDTGNGPTLNKKIIL